ncbi:MAG: tetratricopeptide repeat protein [Tenuifilaceae bacterium]
MKRIRFKHLAFISVAAIILSGCGGVDKMKEIPAGFTFKVTPNPLEVHGNKVKGTIEGTIPAKYFNKKAIVEVTPVLVYQGGELPLAVKVLQGQDVQANNQVISYDAGGSVKHDIEFDYKDEMFKSELELRMVISYKDKKIPYDKAVKIGVGVLATYKLVEIDPKPIMMKDNKYVRIIPENKEAQINFVIQKAEVRKSELTKDEVKMLQDFIAQTVIDSTKQFKGINVSAYASPDGPEDLNTKLSGDRGKSTEKWLSDVFKKAKVATKDKNYVSVQTTAEDWDGFKSLVSASDVQDKELILRVLSMYSDPAVREKEIKNLSKVYLVLAEKILPQLRRSKMIANVDKVGYSDDDFKKMLENNSYDNLTVEEMMYAVGLVEGADKKLEVYKKAAEKFNDVRAHNNMAYLYLLKKDVANAKAALDKVASSNEPAVKNNRGCVALMEGDIDGAEKIFADATNAGQDVKYNLGIISIIKNQYPAAVEYLGGTDSFNQGLSLLLVNKNDAAKNTFQKVDSAKGFYGLAIVGARLQDEAMLLTNLRTAIGKDAALKARAKNDLEFLKYLQNDAFKAIVE